MGWDKNRRERLKEVCKGDALLKLWQISIDVPEDGSSTVTRKIVGENLADRRSYYEIESWTDPERDPEYEKRLKNLRKIVATVYTHTKKGALIVCKDKHFPPEDAHRVNRVIHEIPMVDGNPLEVHDTFEIHLTEQTEKGSWKMSGDRYELWIRHVSERLRIEILLPKWRFPSEMPSKEKPATVEMKDPSCGEWNPIDERPEVKKIRGRWIIALETKYPKLLNIYKLTYHSMERVSQV